jgi:citrate lyase gamma subunit
VYPWANNMPPFAVIYPDSNCLIKEGWPDVSTTLRNLAAAAEHRGVRLVLLDSVEQELEAHYIREFQEKATEASGKFHRLARIADRAALQVELSVPSTEQLGNGYRAAVEEVLATYHIERATVPLRESKELYRMAVYRQAPFAKEGSGFQDAIICLAAIDHLAATGLRTCAFLTNDGIFNDQVLGRLAQPKEVSLRLFEDAKGAYDCLVDDALKERYAQHDEDRKRATAAIKSRIPDIERFIRENLEMPHYFRGDEVLQIINIKVVGIDDALTPITQTDGEPSAVSAQVSIEVTMILKPGLFSNWMPSPSLKLGKSLELPTYFPERQPRESIQQATVAMEFRAIVENGNYRSIEPVSLRLA